MSAPSASAAVVLAQYVVVRADLMKKLGWNVGSVVAQAVHAAVASVHISYGEEDTKKYLRVRFPEIVCMFVLRTLSRIHVRNIFVSFFEKHLPGSVRLPTSLTKV